MTGQLPPAGGTSQARPSEPPPTDALSLDEAVAAYGVSQSTLRRRLREDQVAGAFKVHGPKGDEWRIPAGALEALGYTQTSVTATPPMLQGRSDEIPPPPPAPPELERLAASVTELVEQLGAERRQLMAAEEDRGQLNRDLVDARVDAGRLKHELAAERARRQELEQRLRRRRWFRR